MTFIQPNKNKSLLNAILFALSGALIASTFGMVWLYNATVNTSHNIDAAKAELDTVGAEVTDLNNQVVAALLRELGEHDLASVIHEFGGERYAGRIARAIVLAEKRARITTSGALAEVVRGALPKGYERGRIDPATRTFQALRIYANDELGNLARAIETLPLILKPGGRAVVISFHSLEDGIVKRAFRRAEKEAAIEVLTPKPVEASPGEVRGNPRSRSAKLRAARIAP